jgi:hypothetical protein
MTLDESWHLNSGDIAGALVLGFLGHVGGGMIHLPAGYSSDCSGN